MNNPIEIYVNLTILSTLKLVAISIVMFFCGLFTASRGLPMVNFLDYTQLSLGLYFAITSVISFCTIIYSFFVTKPIIIVEDNFIKIKGLIEMKKYCWQDIHDIYFCLPQESDLIKNSKLIMVLKSGKVIKQNLTSLIINNKQCTDQDIFQIIKNQFHHSKLG